MTLTLGVKAIKTVFLLLLASKAFESKVGPSQVELIIVPHSLVRLLPEVVKQFSLSENIRLS
jgi:hypothetical protein